jgi:hypothetical protein
MAQTLYFLMARRMAQQAECLTSDQIAISCSMPGAGKKRAAYQQGKPAIHPICFYTRFTDLQLVSHE